jgi:hypothetical protein
MWLFIMPDRRAMISFSYANSRPIAVDWVNELLLTQSTKGDPDGRFDHR